MTPIDTTEAARVVDGVRVGFMRKHSRACESWQDVSDPPGRHEPRLSEWLRGERVIA
jgi:hypothetical protein